MQDLFDRIGGGGRPERLQGRGAGSAGGDARFRSRRRSTPVGIVGVQLEATTPDGSATHDGTAPGRGRSRSSAICASRTRRSEFRHCALGNCRISESSSSVFDVLIIGGRSGRTGGGDRRQASAASAIWSSRRARSSIRSLHYPTRHGVLHDAGAARDWRAAVREPVREADAARGAALLPARDRHVRARHRARTRPVDRRSAATATAMFSVTSQPTRRAGATRLARGSRAGDRRVRLCRTGSACRARICRTSRTTTASRTRYYRRRVVIVGGKNSAAEAALDLYRNGARA